MTEPFPSPMLPEASRTDVFVGYLDYFRRRVVEKIQGLDEVEQRRSRLPSGWTPVELLKHLTFVELRWLEWGFEGRAVEDPWGDQRDGRWYVAPAETVEDLVAALEEQAVRTRAVITGNDLAEVGRPGPRWEGAEPATLERVLFHLLQEYARHLGHLDIVAELAHGPVGE
ncbi:MAG TPA: DinB family protein [Marmoricola sp.]